jgi:hypothetical protein
MDNFDWSPPELDIIFDDDADEIDVQSRLLKKRTKNTTEFYVEYDRFNNTVLSISPSSIAESVRTGVFTSADIALIEKIFAGTLPLNKLTVRYNREIKSRELSLVARMAVRSEFDYVYAQRSSVPAPIHITFDTVFKKALVDIHYDRMKEYISADELSEHDLERSNARIDLYCIDSSDRTRLFDKISINIFELCNTQRLEKACPWLPDSMESFDKLSLLYYNNDMPISFALASETTVDHTVPVVNKPQIIYQQSHNRVQLQSTMESANNYKINDYITLYFFDKSDPTCLYMQKRIPRSDLNNFNLIELDENLDRPVRIITDHHHIHIEDGNASTYFRI